MTSAVECVTTEKDRLDKEREGHQGNTRAGSYCVEVKSRWGVGRSTSPPFPDGSELKNNAASHVGRNRHVTV